MYLEDLYVAPAARGRGCGTLLLQSLAAIAQRKDCARLQWQALDWNRKAVDFYTSSAVGARERIGADGTRWLNFIMDRTDIAHLASNRGEPSSLVEPSSAAGDTADSTGPSAG
jgi:GNAT superfamily N-acetyltransferase